ncbi:hypothetical protein KCP76_16055 [Salmonella enterica subsp. enterica serovar Weltevreden]|nr:hypothetical protein KCP76_16055 [Salmonella enterica subsp. enterica serovar Weltevreden]
MWSPGDEQRGRKWARRSGDIETACVPGKGKLTYTGSLGEVMQESHSGGADRGARARGKTGYDGLYENAISRVHVPEGATPKTVESAGIAILYRAGSTPDR